MQRLESFWELLRDVFPARSERVSLELVSAQLREERALVATLRLLVWERGEDGALQIRDVKEQELFVGDVEILADPRLEACVRGSNLALEQLFAQEQLEWVEVCMPSDLLHAYEGLLRLKRPRSAEDFAEALLASKQRLGRFVR